MIEGKKGVVIDFPIRTKSTEIRRMIQREILSQSNKDNPYLSAKEIWLNFADVLELNSIYLSEMDQDSLQPVIENEIDICARIRALFT